MKDIFAVKKKDVPGGGPAEYPADYPFEELLQFAIDCKDVVAFFQNHHVPKAKLKKALAVAKLSGLVQPAPTRWGTLNACFKLLRAAGNILIGLVSERDFITAGNAKQQEKHVAIKAVITDPDFIIKLDECISILKPIDMYLKIFQSDAVLCSDVYKAFVELEEKMRNLPNVDADKKDYLHNSNAHVRLGMPSTRTDTHTSLTTWNTLEVCPNRMSSYIQILYFFWNPIDNHCETRTMLLLL